MTTQQASADAYASSKAASASAPTSAAKLVADTTRPLLVWEKPYYPTYYFPAADVHTDLLTRGRRRRHSPSRGDAKIFTVSAGGQERAGAALLYEQSPFDELQRHDPA